MYFSLFLFKSVNNQFSLFFACQCPFLFLMNFKEDTETVCSVVYDGDHMAE